MATAKLPLESIIGTFKHTLCHKIDLDRVGSSLAEEGKISKHLAKYVKKAMKKKDKSLFFSVLTKFDLKNFVVFLEVLDTINDRPHHDILKLLCHDLQQHFSWQSATDQEVVTRLQSIVLKYSAVEGAIESEHGSQLVGRYSEQTGEGATLSIEGITSSLSISEPVIQSSTPTATLQGLTTKQSHLEGLTMVQDKFSTTEQPEGLDTVLSAPPESKSTFPTLPQGEGSVDGTILYYKHPVERFSFSRTNCNVFHSPINEISVSVESNAFPKGVDEFDLSLTVNDYSQPITMPSQYTGAYSALIGLKCEPHFEKFEHYVTVTLPHCAVGDLDSLCVLSAADGDSHLVEDPDILIQSIDEKYIEFTTTHFTVFRAAKGEHGHYRTRTSSLEAGKQSPGQIAVRRYYSCPTPGVGGTTAIKFCAAMFRPRDTSNLSHWQFVVIFVYDLPSFSAELESHASVILGTTNLVPDRGPFTFGQSPIHLTNDLTPSLPSDNGWTVWSIGNPAVPRESVEQYWLMSPEERQRNRLFLPCIKYEVSKNNATSTQRCIIELKGSISSLAHKPVSFQVALWCEPQNRPAPELNTIKIIREMYRTSSILEALSENCGCSDILLCTTDVDCCTLVCEISFCLDRWEDLGRNLRMREQDIRVIKCQYQWRSLFEAAYQMLTKWIVRSIPNLGMLIEGLRSINTTLEVSSVPVTWSSAIKLKPMNEVFVKNLAQTILCNWKFIARLLGESETDICQAVGRSEHDIHEQAYQMLWKWKRQRIENMETFEELARAIHCMRQHTHDMTLDEAVELLTS